MLAVYCPPTSTRACLALQEGIFAYVRQLIHSLEGGASRLVMAGDFNAVTCPAHRSNNTILPMDTRFAAFIHDMGLMSCFEGDQDKLPHTCRSGGLKVSARSSRIDDTRNMGPGVRIATTDVNHVLHDELYDASDHHPVLKALGGFPDLLPGMSPQSAAQAGPAAQGKVQFLSFPADKLNEWQNVFLSNLAQQMTSLKHQLTHAICQPANGASDYDSISSGIQDLIAGASDTAKDIFDMRETYRPRRTFGAGRPAPYLPRVQARQHRGHVADAKACRIFAQAVVSHHSSNVPYGAFVNSCQASPTPLCHSLQQLTASALGYNALLDQLQDRRAEAQSSANQILRDHRAELGSADRRRFQALWRTQKMHRCKITGLGMSSCLSRNLAGRVVNITRCPSS